MLSHSAKSGFQLSGMLQSCQSLDEILAAVQTYAGYLFPEEGGALYLLNEARDGVARGSQWGTLMSDVASFHPEDCWALRRGTTFPTSQASQRTAEDSRDLHLRDADLLGDLRLRHVLDETQDQYSALPR